MSIPGGSLYEKEIKLGQGKLLSVTTVVSPVGIIAFSPTLLASMYDTFQFDLIDLFPSGADAILFMYLGQSGNFAFSHTYGYEYTLSHSGGGNAITTALNGLNTGALQLSTSTPATMSVSGEVVWTRGQAGGVDRYAIWHTSSWNNTAGNVGEIGGGGVQLTGVNQCQFAFPGFNITGGTVRCYGLRTAALS